MIRIGSCASRMLVQKHTAIRWHPEEAIQAGIPICAAKPFALRSFNKIVTQAHHNGEPGMPFPTQPIKEPCSHLYRLESTNPCGEQWLGPYENCCPGSINLAKHLGPTSPSIGIPPKTVEIATIFLTMSLTPMPTSPLSRSLRNQQNKRKGLD